MLTAARLREVLRYEPETGLFTRLLDSPGARQGEVAGSEHHTGYIYIYVDGKSYAAHRLAWLYMTGEWPVGHTDHKDHKDGVPSHNAWLNLRPATRTENMRNRKTHSNVISGLKGAHFRKDLGRYMARIRVNKKLVHLGTYASAEEAHAVYVAAARRMFGEFACDGERAAS